MGQRTRYCENRDLIDYIGHFIPRDYSSAQPSTLDPNLASRFHLIAIFDHFADSRSHAQEHRKYAGPSVVQTDIADQKIRIFLRRRRHQPEGSARNVARNCEVSGFRYLVAIQRHGESPSELLSLRLNEKIRHHSLGMIPCWERLNDCGLTGCLERGKQNRAFDLGARNRKLIPNRAKRLPANDEGSRAVCPGRLNGCAHLGKWLDDPAHWS